MKEWRYIKPLETENLILEVEEKLGCKFTDSYVDFVKKYNGSRPPVLQLITLVTTYASIEIIIWSSFWILRQEKQNL